ncbi:MAG TPA: hypothetical protein VH092_02735 [Urbifossiella sp.]|nr:hypothetical protein [Urbifossiella sp.]
MIVIPRRLARDFRALARRCVAGRPRGPAPPVVLEARAGTLTVWVHLPVDTGGKFPDVAGIVPRDPPTAARIDPRDAAELRAALAGLPGADADHAPVTLDLTDGVVVRGRDEDTGSTRQVRLGRSAATGPPARAGVNRQALARALGLGCTTIRIVPGRPVVFEGVDKTLVVAALEPTPADSPTRPDAPHRRTAVRHESNGHPPAAEPPAADPLDPLAAAEEFRTAALDLAAKAARLVAALKAREREQKALTQAWSSLKALNLGPGGTP